MATSPSPSPNGHNHNVTSAHGTSAHGDFTNSAPANGAAALTAHQSEEPGESPNPAPKPPARGSRSPRRRAGSSVPKAEGAARSWTVGEIARLLGAELVGDAQTLITGVAGLDSTGPGMISFIDSERLLEAALESGASAIIAPSRLALQVGGQALDGLGLRGGLSKPILLTGNPRLAFAKVMEHVSPLSLPERGVHASAIIEPTAHIGAGVSIREGCYIGHHARIGDGVVLYPHVVIGDGAQVGEASIFYASVVIQHHVHIGRRVRVHPGSVIGGDGFGYVMDGDKHVKMPQVGTVIIEDDVEIGSNVCIDRATMGATRIGSGTKIDNLVQIAHNVQVGRNCILCGQVGLSGSVIVEDNVVMAGQAGLADHVKVGRGAIVVAKAGIMSDVEADSAVMGSPAMPQREFLKREAAARKLPETIRAMRKMERDIQELQAQIKALLQAKDES